MISFLATGNPEPKGSAKAFVIKPKGGGKPRAVVTSANPRVKGWQQTIAATAQAHAGAFVGEGGVCLRLKFLLARPASLPKKVVQHTKKPDLDKLARAVKDALKGVLYKDDSQVVRLIASKHYAPPDAPPSVEVFMWRPEEESS